MVFLGLAAVKCGSPDKRTSSANDEPAFAKHPVPPAAHEPECEQCRIEDQKQAAHRDQVTLMARYLGLAGRYLDGKPTRQRCSAEDEVMGMARFEVLARAESARKRGTIVVTLPCPELARAEYAKLYHYDPGDTERDGLGHAPVLRPGVRYRLTLVRDSDPPTLVAVDPR